MAAIQPPPTYAEVVITDEKGEKPKFNPIWLKWFLDLAQTLDESGGTTILHNNTSSIQGGAASQRYHLTAAQAAILSSSKVYPTMPDGSNQTVAGIYAGDGAPNNAEGSNGDFYFRGNGTKAGNTVIYHKEAGAWVALVTA